MADFSSIGQMERARLIRSRRIDWLRRLIDHLRGRTRAARNCFCDEKGELTHDGAKVLAELFDMAGANRLGFQSDPRRQDYDMGAQNLVRQLIDMMHLDDRRIERLEKILEQQERAEDYE